MKPSFITRVTRSRPLLIMGVIGLLIALVAQLVPASTHSPALAFGPHASALSHAVQESNREGDRSATSAAQEQYANRALPKGYVAYAQATAARKAFLSLPFSGNPRMWQQWGGTTATQAGFLSFAFSNQPSSRSGRVTALAIAPDCAPNHNCRMWVGAAGGGVWRTDNGLAPKPQWFASSNGLTSNSIGSLLVDPTDPSGNTLYAGTGESSGSSDSEAGVGLFMSTNGGRNWTLISGSVAYSKDRAIGAIAVDPVNSQHIFMGTDVARHGASSINGGRFTPPGAPPIGLYESTDGGATWTQDVLPGVTSDSVDPTTANGADFFRGGVTKIELNRTGLSSGDDTRVFVSVFDYGLYRRAPLEGDVNFAQVFSSQGQGLPANSAGARTEFSLAPLPGNTLRIYLGDTDGGFHVNLVGDAANNAEFYRTDLGLKPGLFGQGAAGPPGPVGDWTKISNPIRGTTGWTSFNFCSAQCSYDMVVYSPPGFPDTVYLSGQMQYGELGGFTFGRAVQRSVDMGNTFTDMAGDAGVYQNIQEGLHPDHHALLTVPGYPDLAITGSDGGVARLDGNFVDATNLCDALFGINHASSRYPACLISLSAIPKKLYQLNDGLPTLQFESLSLNPQDPLRDGIAGTQDNGTWNVNNGPLWQQSIFGDGGNSGIDFASPNLRIHTYTGSSTDVNFNGGNMLGWDYVGTPLRASNEAFSFYAPVRTDPKVSGTIFFGGQHVWRTKDWGGTQSSLDANCSTFTITSLTPPGCGDWQPMGMNLSGAAASRSNGNYVVAIARTPTDSGTMWVGTRRGWLWVTKNADASSAASVNFYRVDNVNGPGTPTTPRRFPSGIVIDPTNSNHAWISYSGYSAYSALDIPPVPTNGGGHVYEAWYNSTAHTATFTDVSYNLGDMPITGIQRDDKSGDLYVSTDFGVAILPSGSTVWQEAANGLPPVAVYGLTIDVSHRVLYAATHGRSLYRIFLAP